MRTSVTTSRAHDRDGIRWKVHRAIRDTHTAHRRERQLSRTPAERDHGRPVERECEGHRSARHAQPARLLVERDIHPVAPAVAELGYRSAQRDQRAVPLEHRAVGLALALRTVEARPLERVRRLRVHDLARVPSEALELVPPPLAHRPAEALVGVIGEIEERARGRPLLTHEEHGDERREQDDRRGDLGALDAAQVDEPLAPRAVAHLVVILAVREEAVGGQIADGTPVAPPAEGGAPPVVHEDVAQRLREVFDAPEIAVVPGVLAGEDGVERVMEVVAPLRVTAPAAVVAVPYYARVVEVALGDDPATPPGALPELVDPRGELFDDVGRRE